MSLFDDIALPLAERGFRVFPLIPKQKRPFAMAGEYDHFDVASTDAEQIRAWSTQEPNANVGVSPDEIFCFVETDDEAALKEACADLPPEVWDTTRVSARENRCYFIFRQTMRTKRAGNMTAAREGQENLFEFKQHRMYVTGPGSIHPKTGTPYQVEWRTIPALPDVLLNRLCELYGAPKASGAYEISEAVKRETALLDRFLGTYEVATTGDWFNKGKQWYRPIECPWREAHENPNEGTSTCVVYMAGGGYGFDCKHRCSSKGWKEFRAELERRFPERKFSFVGNVGPEVVIGQTTATAESVTIAKKQVRPVFPDEAWAGTIFGEFADIVCRGSFIRKRLASESFRAITGAICGDQVTCGIAGVRMREYHAIIANRQSGKSYGVDCAAAFFTKPSLRCLFEPLLMVDCGPNKYRVSGIGAQRFLPGSSNSFVDELTREKKPKKGEDVNVILGPLWKPTARFITIQGEAMALFSRLCSPDWTGQALSALVTDLYDSLDAEVAVTKDRATPKIPVQLQYSMLLCTQPQIWRKYMAAHMMDSGLFGRFYIVGSEMKPKKVLLPDYSDADLFQEHFGALRRDVFARLDYLREHPLRMTIAPAAKRRLEDWENALPDDEDMDRDLSSRMGLHIWRAAMARAWGAIPQRTEIMVEDAEAAIKLGEYQVKMRQYYAPTPGDSPRWKHLNAVKAAVEQAGQISLRDLRRTVRADRFPEDFDWALTYLDKRGHVVTRKEGKSKTLCWVIQD